VTLAAAVVRAGEDFTPDGSPHVSDFFRSFIHQEDDEINLGMIGADGVRELLEERRLASFWRRDNERTLPFAYRTKKIHDAHRDVTRMLCECDSFTRCNSRSPGEFFCLLPLFGWKTIDREDLTDSFSTPVVCNACFDDSSLTETALGSKASIHVRIVSLFFELKRQLAQEASSPVVAFKYSCEFCLWHEGMIVFTRYQKFRYLSQAFAGGIRNELLRSALLALYSLLHALYMSAG
jgi:hypothetical protein